MGRLKLRIPRQLQLAGKWGVPVVIAVVVVFAIHSSVNANPAPSPGQLLTYLEDNNLQVGIEPVKDFQQVYYQYEGSKVFVTDNRRLHAQADTWERYITWVETINGAGQIMLYDAVNKTTLQLTNSGTHQKPAVSEQGVVWESWTGTGWQINYFDGLSTETVSEGAYTAVSPDISDSAIVYSEQLAVNSWRVTRYDLASKQREIVAEGDSTLAWPRFENGELKTDGYTGQ